MAVAPTDGDPVHELHRGYIAAGYRREAGGVLS
jgi:hypothetical protein